MPKRITYYISGGIDPDALLFIEAAAITDGTSKSAINTLVKSFKAGGVWNNLEAAYPLLSDKTNQLTYTEDYSNAGWGKVAVTATSVSQNTPVGTSTCYNIVPTATTAWHYLSRSIPLAPYVDGDYVISVYAKANGYDWLRFVMEDGIGGFSRVWFNVNTGVVGTNNSGGSVYLKSVAITAESYGFYRISMVYQGDGRSLLLWTSPSSADNQSGTWLGDGTSGVLVIGHQLEFVSLSTYEPVTASVMASQAMYNLKNPLDTDAAHSIVWNSTLGGWSTKGYTESVNMNNYGNIKLVPATYLQQDNAHLSITIPIDYGLGAQFIDFGLFDSSGVASSFHVTPSFSTQGMRVRLNSSVPTTLQFNSTTIGTFMGNRVNSSQIELYVDGLLVDTETIASTGLSTLSMYIGGINENGLITVNPNRRLTFASVGNGLTAAQALAMKNAIATFNTTLNR